MQELTDFIHDARRFIYHHKPAIETAALQVYASALIFSPQCSVIRKQFSCQMPKWVAVKPDMDDHWDAHMQTIYTSYAADHASYSPDGRYIAVSNNGISDVYETASGDFLHQELAAGSFTSTPVYSPDGLLLCCGVGRGIAILQATTFRLIRKLRVKADQIFFLPEGNNIAVAFKEDVSVLDWKTGERVSRLKRIINRRTKVVLLSASLIATLSPGKTEVKVWDLATGDCRHTFDWNGKKIGSVACSLDGHRIAAASEFAVRLWDLTDTQGWVHKHDLSHRDDVGCLSFSADSRMVISGSNDNFIRIWDETGVCIEVLKGHSQPIRCLSVCRMRKRLASGSYDGTVKLWDLSDILSDQLRQKRSSSLQTFDHSFQQSEQDSCSDENLRIDGLVFSPTGSMLASLSCGETHIWDTVTDACTHLLFSGGASGHDGVSFTPDDRLVAMRDMDGKLGVWDTKLKAQIHFSDLEDPEHIAISADGRYVSSLSDTYGKEVKNVLKIWDLAKDAQTQQHITSGILPFRKYKRNFSRFVYSEDWKVLALSDTLSRLQVLHLNSGYWVNEQPLDVHATPLAFSPDSQWLLTYKKVPSSFASFTSFAIRNMTSPYVVKELGFLEAWDSPYATPELEDNAWRITTRFGILGVGKPSDFKGTARIGWGLTADMNWIMRGNERMLWIPADYRRLALDVNGSRVAFVCPSGQIKIIKFR
jgi:WD40 repeat protein